MLGTIYGFHCSHVEKPLGLSAFALVGPEGLGVQSSANMVADLETQCLPLLQDLAKKQLILGGLEYHEQHHCTWLCG